jgi:hypothetical protein
VLTTGYARFVEHASRWCWSYLGRIPRGSRSAGHRKHGRSPLRWIADRRDERRALRLRDSLGRRRWLVSWRREVDDDGDGCWCARVSCPALVDTLERTGKTRTEAIERAARVLTLRLNFRGAYDRQTGRVAENPWTPDDLVR